MVLNESSRAGAFSYTRLAVFFIDRDAMISNTELTALIASIYDAASDPGQWSQFLAMLSRITGGTSALILMHETKRANHTISASWAFEPKALRLYQERYGALDVWAERGHIKPAGHVCTSESLSPVSELVRTEFYNDFARPHDVKHGMFGVVANQSNTLASVSVFRDPTAGQFADGQLEVLRLIIPHVQRAFAIHFTFADLQSRTAGFESALIMIQLGVVMISPKGKVLSMNRSANRNVSAANGLRIRAGKLCAVKDRESEHLRVLIEGAVTTIVGDGHSAGGTMLVSRPVGRPMSLTVAPLRAKAWPEEPAAVIFIADPDERTELPNDLLRRCYGLTIAESRLAIILVEGRSLKEAAAQTRVSVQTIRTQLKSVFAKTGVKRQGELIQLLLRSSGFQFTPFG
jgi:DNA-binding CsgD family transcriptional regulator